MPFSANAASATPLVKSGPFGVPSFWAMAAPVCSGIHLTPKCGAEFGLAQGRHGRAATRRIRFGYADLRPCLFGLDVPGFGAPHRRDMGCAFRAITIDHAHPAPWRNW